VVRKTFQYSLPKTNKEKEKMIFQLIIISEYKNQVLHKKFQLT